MRPDAWLAVRDFRAGYAGVEAMSVIDVDVGSGEVVALLAADVAFSAAYLGD